MNVNYTGQVRKPLPKLVKRDGHFVITEISGTVPVTGSIAPTSTADTYPSHMAVYGQGGLRTVATLVERDAIADERREEGMKVYVTADRTWWQLNPGLTSWSSAVTIAEPGTPDNNAIQFKGVPGTGISLEQTSYNNVNYDFFHFNSGGKSGPGFSTFAVVLGPAPFNADPNNAESSDYILWGPLITEGGQWLASSHRLLNHDAAGKKHHMLQIGYFVAGMSAAENWIIIARDYPSRTDAGAGFMWDEPSRNVINFGAQVSGVRFVVPDGTLSGVGVVHSTNFYKTGLANTGLACLAVNTQSIIAEGMESVRIDKPTVVNTTGLNLQDNGIMYRVQLGPSGSGPGGVGRMLYVEAGTPVQLPAP